MEFRGHQAIYLQIVDYVCERILLKVWKAEEKMPSIRELAIELQVNPNTVQRSYDFLQEMEVITNKRGIGIFVEKGRRPPGTDLQERRIHQNRTAGVV